MAQPSNERIAKQKIEQAYALAKKGQYQKARYLLHDVQNHPAAKKLLKQMDGRNDKITGGLSYFYSGTLLVMIGLAVVVIFVVWNFTGSVQTSVADRNEIFASFTERGLTGNVEQYVDLAEYCVDRAQPESVETCLDWAQLVMVEYNEAVYACVLVTEDGLQYRGREMDNIEACYNEQGIPDPSA